MRPLRRPDDPARIARWVVGLSLLALLAVGLHGGRLMPVWGETCPSGDGCDPVHLRTLVLRAWALHGFGLAALVAGMVAIGRSRPRHPEGDGVPDEHAATPWRHAAWVSGFVAVSTAITAAVLGVGFVFGGLMLGAIVAAWWVGLTVVLDALDRLARPDSDRRGSWWRALAVSTATVAAIWLVPVAVTGVERRGWSEAFLLVVAMLAAVAGLATLWSRLAPGGPRETATPRPHRVLGVAVAGSVLLPLGLGLFVDVDGGTRYRAGELLADLLNPYPAEQPQASAAPPPPPEPPPSPPSSTSRTSGTPTGSPAPAPSPSPSTPSVATCRVGALGAEATGWDSALGTRAVTLVVTNEGRPCSLAGYPRLRLLEGDDPLGITVVHPGHGVDGHPVSLAPVTLDDGGSARVVLWWRAAGAPPDDADREDQRLRLVLDPASAVGSVRSVPVALGERSPFDLADGSRVRMEPWTAPAP